MDLTALKVRAYRVLPPLLQRFAVRVVTPNFTVGVIGLITLDGSQVLLVRPSYRWGWVPPGGFIGRREQPMAAVNREVREELGLDVEFEPWHRVAFDEKRQGVAFVMVAKLSEKPVLVPRSAEILEVDWFPVDQLPPMPHDFFEGMPDEDLAAVRSIGRRA